MILNPLVSSPLAELAQFSVGPAPTSQRDSSETRVRAAQPAKPADIEARKLALLQKSGVFSSDTRGCTFERACSLPDLRSAYALVHDVFVSNGFITPETGGMRLRVFEACPETATFVAKKEGQVVGVLSVVIDSPQIGLPSDGAFQMELDALRETGMRLCELTNQAVAKEYRRSGLMTELMRCAIAYILDVGCDRALATVSPSHTAFYQLMGFGQLGAMRSYSTKLDDPVVAMTVDLRTCLEKTSFASGTEAYVFDFMLHANRFRALVADWSSQAAQSFLSAELLNGLLCDQRNFLGECSISELSHLRNQWGDQLFESIWQKGAVKAPLPLAEVFTADLNVTQMPSDWRCFKAALREYFSPEIPWWDREDQAAAGGSDAA